MLVFLLYRAQFRTKLLSFRLVILNLVEQSPVFPSGLVELVFEILSFVVQSDGLIDLASKFSIHGLPVENLAQVRWKDHTLQV
jgi:hypothetical protein